MTAAAMSLEEIASEARKFRDGCMTLHLATSNPASEVVASYAPYALSPSGGFYIYVSELAEHTGNLLSGCKPSAMFIEPERDADQYFARKRLTCRCEPRQLMRDSSEFFDALAALRNRFGALMDHLARLKDFRAFELMPLGASYVRGFGQAYFIPDASFASAQHRDEQGHRNAS